MYTLTNCRIYTGTEELREHAILIENNKIVDLIPDQKINLEIPRFDLKGHHICPGFIDLQLNGCGGIMFNDAIDSPETLKIMHETNLKSGTTSFLPTLITAPDEDIFKAIAIVAAYRQNYPYTVLGLHLEGPYLNPKRKGIHNPMYIRQPDQAMIEHIAKFGKEVVKIVTLAPEMVDPDYTHLLAASGIIVSIGHSDATFAEAIAGFDAGVGMATHLFNAMSPWLGRNPGVVGAVFSRPDVYAGIIADGHHTHFTSIALAHQIKQNKLILVTDATPPVGTEMTSFVIGGSEVFYQDGKCISADGTLGGSALTMIEAVANCVNYVKIPLAEALRMAATYPAKSIGVDDHLGIIAPNYIANLAIFDDNFQIVGMVDQGHLNLANISQ